jgi:formylglycine-generating enzyme required for sulfatase activity
LDDKIPVYSVNGQTNPESWNYTPCHGNSLTGTVVMNINANGYRLPTEAEWEYAARGGKKTKGYKYSGSNKLKDVAWYSDNSGSQIHDVATKSPNELGLYDMSGNVFEWCWDWYGPYTEEKQTNPVGPSSGYYRVGRGGSWGHYSDYCRVAYRSDRGPYSRDIDLGFRLVRSAQ